MKILRIIVVLARIPAGPPSVYHECIVTSTSIARRRVGKEVPAKIDFW
jgi:hypothetical protein